MIYDCFTFFNELDLLEIRLNVLNDVVDKFVLVEMNKTHNGKDKPLYYNDNKERYQQFHDKIIHVIVDDYPEFETSWTYENYQRNCISKGVQNCNDEDVILISDLDEIPNPQKIIEFQNTDGIKIFEQNMYYYFINYINTSEQIWLSGTRMLTYKNFKSALNDMNVIYNEYLIESLNKDTTASKIRFFTDGVIIKNAGWHFSYLGGVEAIAKKIQSFSHQEFNSDEYTNLNKIKKRIENGDDIFGRGYKYQAVKLDKSFPQYILDNQEKYKHLICDYVEARKYQSNVNKDNDPRRYFIDWIETENENAKVLDVGCACGDFIQSLKSEKNILAYGMEYDQKSIDIAKQTNSFEEIFQVDLNNFDETCYSMFIGAFDYICFGDVLEHILFPELILNTFKSFLKPTGKFLISVPNIAHASVKSNLLLNNFDYTDTGILDKTHVKFFTYKSIAQLLSNCNLKFENCKFTDWAGICGTQNNNPYKDLSNAVKKIILKDKHSFVVQYVVECAVSDDDDLCEYNLDILDKTIYLNKKFLRKPNNIHKLFINLLCLITPVKKWRKKLRGLYK